MSQRRRLPQGRAILLVFIAVVVVGWRYIAHESQQTAVDGSHVFSADAISLMADGESRAPFRVPVDVVRPQRFLGHIWSTSPTVAEVAADGRTLFVGLVVGSRGHPRLAAAEATVVGTEGRPRVRVTVQFGTAWDVAPLPEFSLIASCRCQGDGETVGVAVAVLLPEPLPPGPIRFASPDDLGAVE